MVYHGRRPISADVEDTIYACKRCGAELIRTSVCKTTGPDTQRPAELLDLVASGLLRPDLLVTRELTLDEAGEALATLGSRAGISVVTTF